MKGWQQENGREKREVSFWVDHGLKRESFGWLPVCSKRERVSRVNKGRKENSEHKKKEKRKKVRFVIVRQPEGVLCGILVVSLIVSF